MRKENVASLQTYDRRRTRSFPRTKFFDMDVENAEGRKIRSRRRLSVFD
jgi:hypothetical protein